MLKRICKTTRTVGVALLCACLLLAVGMMPSAYAAGDTATLSKQPIYIDGYPMSVPAYSIKNANYVRLRNMANAVGFDVTYDSRNNTISIATKEPYSGGAAELGATPETTEAVETALTVLVDGRPTTMSAYNIGGNNYIKLRDIGAAVGFSVEWDAATNRVLVDSSKPYTPETVGDHDTQVPDSGIHGGTAEDYSLLANPAIFDSYFTREKYNKDRQRVLDTGTYVFWGTRRPPQSTEAVDAANQFFASLAQMSDQDKVYSINHYLCDHMTYKAETVFTGDDFWTGMAYGVCEDYARAFQYMCYRAGLPCDFLIGNRSPANTTGRHGWNEVFFDGRWHFYDGTLSDSRNRIIIGDTAESANTGYTYTDDNPKSTRYYKEICVPGSTL